ncbi:zinc ribbon domain-containing protein [Kineosporia rhizophila]|nr:zinc ribbon domain-containing protein [Kineosporia rhizophila]
MYPPLGNAPGPNQPAAQAPGTQTPADNGPGPQTSANNQPAGPPRFGDNAGGSPASSNSQRIGIPTTLFATGTTDPKPDPGEAPTLKRGETPPVAPPPPPARPSGGFCRQCGAQLSPGDRFCYSCGAPSGSPASKG